MKSRVFITQENPNLNYLPAEGFGEVVFLTRGDISPIRGSLNNENVVEEIRRKLKDFDERFDFVAPSGSPIVTAVVFMVLSEKTREVNVLRWSNRDCVYQPINIKI